VCGLTREKLNKHGTGFLGPNQTNYSFGIELSVCGLTREKLNEFTKLSLSGSSNMWVSFQIFQRFPRLLLCVLCHFTTFSWSGSSNVWVSFHTFPQQTKVDRQTDTTLTSPTCVWHDSYAKFCRTWLVYMCDMIHIYTYTHLDTYMYVVHGSCICVKKFIHTHTLIVGDIGAFQPMQSYIILHMCDMIHTYVYPHLNHGWYLSVRVTRFIDTHPIHTYTYTNPRTYI